jgi:hypothetical protein
MKPTKQFSTFFVFGNISAFLFPPKKEVEQNMQKNKKQVKVTGVLRDHA